MYLFTDTETTGLTTDCEMLTAGFLLTDDSGKVIDTLVLKCKPELAKMLVDAEALAVNKIDLVEHLKTAETYTKCAHTLLGWLNKHAVSKLNTTLVGHRLDFDLGFLRTKKVMDDLIVRNYFRKYVEDTGVIASFLRIKFNKLVELAEALKIDISDLVAHTELGDCEITRRCYFKMVDMVYGEVNGQETDA
jgi:DNA polymerase III epsilon subunit-like protein